MSAPKPSVADVLRRLNATPAEVAALAVLTCGAVAALALLWWLNRPELVSAAAPIAVEGASETPGLAVSSGEVIVHVAGAVRSPGVYALDGGSRVGDGVDVAGGATRRAVLDGLNLARVLVDGEQVLVPDRRAQSATGPAAAGGSAGAGGATVSLNQATAAELETLPGIGPVLAERIVQHRDTVGGFKEVGDLRDVSGIGEKTFQALVELVAL